MELSVKERRILEKTGGNAFQFTPTQDRHQLTQGMTLRDYFAAKAMQGLAENAVQSTIETGEDYISQSASFSYKIADAMLKARGE